MRHFTTNVRVENMELESPDPLVTITKRRIGAGDDVKVDYSYHLQREEALSAFLIDATSREVQIPEGGTPCLMKNDCNNTRGEEEIVYRVWDTETGEVESLIYSTEEAGDVLLEHLRKKGIELPQSIGYVSLYGFDPISSGYMKDEGLTVSIRELCE